MSDCDGMVIVPVPCILTHLQPTSLTLPLVGYKSLIYLAPLIMTLFAPVSIIKGMLSVSTMKLYGSCGMGVECTEAVDNTPMTDISIDGCV